MAIYSCQGFRDFTTQLLQVLNYFTYHVDNGHPIDVIYLDFQKAFDSVPHQRLLQKVSSFGIHGKILMWIKDFLSNREQQVVLNGHISQSIPVTSGVPHVVQHLDTRQVVEWFSRIWSEKSVENHYSLQYRSEFL